MLRSEPRARLRAAQDRRRSALPVGVLVGLGFVGALGGLCTYAYWQDTESVNGTTITSGSLDLRIGGQQGPYAWTALSMADMAPGESKAATLTVNNAGTTPFVLTATAASAGGLATSLSLKVVPGGTASTDTTYPRTEGCTGTPVTFDAALPSTATTVIAAGDAVTVQPGASKAVCAVLTLPSSAGNGLQGSTATPTFVLTATQATS